MPHYSDLTEVKVGDLAFGRSHGGADPVAGYVLDVNPQSDTCNMHLAVLRPVPNAENSYGVFTTVGAGHGAPRSHVDVRVEVANCRDFTLLHRKEELVPVPSPGIGDAAAAETR